MQTVEQRIQYFIGKLHENFDKRKYATDALVKIGEPAIEAVIEILSSKNVYARRASAQVLGRIGNARAVEPLILALSDTRHSVREAVADALANLRDPRAIVPLKKAVGDEHRWTCKPAVEALRRTQRIQPDPKSHTTPKIEPTQQKPAAEAFQPAAPILALFGTQNNQTVARGTWIYAGTIKCDARIVRRDRRYQAGENPGQINWLMFETGVFYYLQFGSTTERGSYPQYGHCFYSLEEALERAHKATQGTVAWYGPEAVNVRIEDTVSNIAYDDIVQALKAERIACKPDYSLVTEAKSRICRWAVRTELGKRTSIYTDDHLQHRHVVIRELVKYLEPRQTYSGGFSAGSSPHGPRK